MKKKEGRWSEFFKINPGDGVNQRTIISAFKSYLRGGLNQKTLTLIIREDGASSNQRIKVRVESIKVMPDGFTRALYFDGTDNGTTPVDSLWCSSLGWGGFPNLSVELNRKFSGVFFTEYAGFHLTKLTKRIVFDLE